MAGAVKGFGWSMTAILGLLVQALGELLGLDACLRASNFSLMKDRLTGQVLELVTWSLFLQLLQKGRLGHSVAAWSVPRHLEQRLGPLHFLSQFLVRQLLQMFLLIL